MSYNNYYANGKIVSVAPNLQHTFGPNLQHKQRAHYIQKKLV